MHRNRQPQVLPLSPCRGTDAQTEAGAPATAQRQRWSSAGGGLTSNRLTDEPVSDETLMSAVAGGDMNALGQLVNRHQARALRLARRITGERELAEDVAQETFLRVHRAARRYQPTAKFTTWLHRIVVNLCWDHRRKWEAGPGPAPDRPDTRSPEPVASMVRDETRETVRRAVLALPHRQRLAVVLHRFEGHAIREVADITGWSESAVESCLVRAYRQLRQELRSIGPGLAEEKTAGQ